MSHIGFSHLPVSCDQADTTAVTMWVLRGGGLKVRRASRANGPTAFTTEEEEEKLVSQIVII